jgi:hypothetical protein
LVTAPKFFLICAINAYHRLKINQILCKFFQFSQFLKKKFPPLKTAGGGGTLPLVQISTRVIVSLFVDSK